MTAVGFNRTLAMKAMKTGLGVGEWGEVRSKDEILRTLDGRGQMDGMPFMPEMFKYCGQRFAVFKRAHKTCDTVLDSGGRRLESTVHLETRCDGSAHGGCQASCLIFWKEAWLRKSEGSGERQEGRHVSAEHQGPAISASAGTEAAVYAGTLAAVQENPDDPIFVCQNTQVPYATTQLAWWDIRQYVEDYMSGNVGLWRLASGAIYAGYYNLSQAGIGSGRLMRWLYEKSYRIWRGVPWPRTSGSIAVGEPTPEGTLNLQPGEQVRVKSHAEILKTLNTEGKNRGMHWDAEMVPYCGGTYRGGKRVDRIINEKTGRMIRMKNPCIILDSVVCESRYSSCRMFCPRQFYSYWREIWLERVERSPTSAGHRDR
jgi:hypothetical protein